MENKNIIILTVEKKWLKSSFSSYIYLPIAVYRFEEKIITKIQRYDMYKFKKPNSSTVINLLYTIAEKKTINLLEKLLPK